MAIVSPNLRRASGRLPVLAWALLALAIGIAAPARAQTQAFQTLAKYAILMDADTGSVLFEKAADELMSPASMVKIMTAELVFREIAQGRLRLESKMVVSENAWRTGGAVSRGSTMFAKVNEEIAVADLLRGLIVMSGNDSAIALAEGIAGTEAAFAAMMNKRARELDMRDTNFTNSWGKFDAAQKTTARDLAKLSIHVIKTYPELYKLFGEREFIWNKIKQQNRNPLLGMELGADGLKTGNIEDSGYGLAGSALRGEQRLVLVVNGLPNARQRADESRKLLAWGFRAFDMKDLFKAGEPVGTASVYGGESGQVPLVAKTTVRLMTPRGSTERITGRIEYVGPLIAPVEAGMRVGHLRIYRGKTIALETPLYTANDVKIGSLHSRAFDALLEYSGGLFRKYLFKDKNG
jgi:serine-type D-Ala-D-Ala carboxypeptidase (penicillin-binding protein 5/6)